MNNITGYKPERLFPHHWHIILTALYFVVATVGTVSNGAIIVAFARGRITITPFTMLLLNLSIADFIQDLNIYPYIFIDLKNLHKVPDYTANLVCSFTIGMSVFWVATCASIYTLMFISFFRYTNLLNTVRHRNLVKFTKRHIILFMVVCWLLSAAVIYPNFVSFTLDKKMGICYRTWPETINGTVYIMLTTAVFFLLPIAVLFVNFILTVKLLWDGRKSNAPATFVSKRRRQVAALLLKLVLVFIVCWTPIFLYFVVSRSGIFKEGAPGEYSKMRVLNIVILIASLNSVCDPILYAFSWETFRKGFMNNSENNRNHSNSSHSGGTLPRSGGISSRIGGGTPQLGGTLPRTGNSNVITSQISLQNSPLSRSEGMLPFSVNSTMSGNERFCNTPIAIIYK